MHRGLKMSLKNRKAEYERLIKNDQDGKTPGISQDDGALVKEFGQAPTEAPKKRVRK